MNTAKDILSKLLRETADSLDTNTSEISDEQALKGIKVLLHEPISKESAALELGIHSSSFDKLIREGKIPKGKKKLGWKELRWYTDEIIDAGKKYKIGKFKHQNN